MSLEPGVCLGRFVVVARLGAGGLGEVYRAKDPSLGRDVAVKVLRPEIAQDPDMRLRFVREARAVAAVRHPNVLVVHETGETAGGLAFMVMELLEGATLGQRLRDGAALELRLAWTLALARALEAVHAVGIVHRDVKPDNVLIVGDQLKLLDFGIAKRDPAQAPTEELGAPSFATGTGKVIGTPRYMAPEQSAGLPVDARLDQFAWGLVAYEMFAGAHPSRLTPRFSAGAGFEEPPTALATVAPALPFGVSAVVMKALSRLPNERFASMSELCAVLSKLAEAAARPSRDEMSTVGSSSYASRPDRELPSPPAPAPPERGSSPRGIAVLTFALGAMAVLLLVSLAALGFTLWQGRTSSAPTGAATDRASAVPSDAAVPTDAAAVGSASAPPPPAPAPAVAAHSAAPTPPAGSRAAVVAASCACMIPSGAYAAHAICTSPAPKCRCKGAAGDICQVPWKFPEYDCARQELPGTSPNQKTGAPCTGWITGPNDTNARGEGALSCTSCSGRRAYKGTPGAPCRGIDDYDGATKAGTWECD